MVIDEMDYGVQPFFIQIRDEETHKSLPGVEVGDIGPKLGYNSKENGFLRLTHFRVPRFSHLCKYIKVSPDGDISLQGNPKVMYAGMMKMRTSIVGLTYFDLLKNCIIALRYSIVRK